MEPISPNAKLSVTLEAQQWNTVVAALHEAPYRVAAPLIQAMNEQLQPQAMQLSASPLPVVQPNGHDRTPAEKSREAQGNQPH